MVELNVLTLLLVVANIGLVVTLAISKIKEKRKNFENSVDELSRLAKKDPQQPLIPWVESHRDLGTEQERLKEITPEEAGAHLKSMGGFPKQDVPRRSKRRGINPLSRFSDRPSGMRNLTRNNGPSPHTRKIGKTPVRPEQDGLANKRVSPKGARRGGE